MNAHVALTNKNILIAGAGVAGPALAYWLDLYGFNVTVVEEAPEPRTGGYIFGLDGIKGIEVLERMGVWPRVQAEKYEAYHYLFVDASRVISRLDVARMTKDVTGRVLTYIKRADLATILYEHTKARAEYLFGDSVRQLTDDGERVLVAFERGSTRPFDLVIGADGLHSIIRTLAFGDESRFKRYMGHYVAAYTIPHYPSTYGEVRFYTMPRKSVTLYALKEGGVIAVFTFRQDNELTYDRRDTERQKQLLAEAYAGEGWQVPALLDAVKTTRDFFFDSVTQIRMPAWSTGRITLVGDAGYCPTLLTGYGSQLALVGAYVLAGELQSARGDHRTAFPAYERELRPFVDQKQRNIRLLRQVVPGSAFGLWMRNRIMTLMQIPSVSRFVAKRTYGRVVREEIMLKGYEKAASS